MVGMVTTAKTDPDGTYIRPVETHFHSNRWVDPNTSILMIEFMNLVTGPRDWLFSANKPNLFHESSNVLRA
jgi:hypothetical protein